MANNKLNPQTPAEAVSKAMIDKLKADPTRQKRTVKGIAYEYALHAETGQVLIYQNDCLIDTVSP